MAKINTLIRRFNEELEQLRPEGYLLQGTVVRRRLRRQVRGGQKDYGPYYLWTRKVDNRTVTRSLTADQAEFIADAIRKNQLLQRRLARLRDLSEKIIFAVTPCVARRKRL